MRVARGGLDGVDANVVRRAFGGQAAGQADEARLGHRVGDRSRQAVQRARRGEHDATVVLRLHDRPRLLRQARRPRVC